MSRRSSIAHTSLASLLALTALGCVPKKTAESTAESTTQVSSVEPAPAGASPSADGPRDHTKALALPSLSAKLKPFFSVGTALEPVQLSEVGDIVVHHFDRFTAENQMKLGPLCPTESCDFSKADQLADFARQNQMKMSGHAFVWHQMQPGWFFKDGGEEASTELVDERLKKHIDEMTKRYADVIDNWDVVNEAISDSAGKTYRDHGEGSPWFKAYGGKAYIKSAFVHAAAAAKAHDPDVKLYYNDYNVVVPEKRRKIIEMVRWLKKEGVQIDGVGLQGHWHLDWPSTAELRRAIDELAAEGVEVKVSELDISIYTKDDHGAKKWQPEQEFTPELQERLTARYREIFQVFEEKSDKLAQVTFWGLADDRTWLNYWPERRNNYPLLFDRQLQPKPALEAILKTADATANGESVAPASDTTEETPSDVMPGSAGIE